MPPVDSSRAISRPLEAPPVASIPEAPAQETVDNVESPQRRSIFKKWFQRKGNEVLALHKLDRRSKKSRESAGRQSPSHSPARAHDRQKGPSTMAASRPKTVSAIPRYVIGCSVLTLFQRTAARSGRRRKVCCSSYFLQSLITGYRINRLPRLLFPRIQTQILPVADKVLRAQTRLTQCVFSW